MQTKRVGYILFFITVLSMLLVIMDNVPLPGILAKIRYIYMAYIWSMLLIYKPFFHKKATVIAGVFTGYCVLFGYILVNPLVIADTHAHTREMLLYILFGFGTALFIKLFGALKEFIAAAAFAHVLTVLWGYFTHFSGFAIIRYLFQLPMIVLQDAGYGFSYGMLSYNSFANIVTSTLWLILLLLSMYMGEKSGKKFIIDSNFLLVGGLFCLLVGILITTTSRGEILSLFMGTFLWLGMHRQPADNKRRRRRTVIVTALYGVLILYLINNIMSNDVAGRTENWSINWERFQEMGRYWTGMGFVNPLSFLMQSFPGYTTFACDVYWYYVFFSTGIIGSVVLGVLLFFLCISVLRKHSFNYSYDVSLKIMVPILIFNNFFHATFFSYNFVSSVIVFAFLLEFLME